MGVEKSKRPFFAGSNPRQQGGPNFGTDYGHIVFQLSAAQILGMFVAPVTLIPGVSFPVSVRAEVGTSQYVGLISAVLQFKPGGTQFAAGGAVSIVYHGGSSSPHGGSVPAATINAATGSMTLLGPPGAAYSAPIGVGLDITNATGPFTTGNGTAIVHLFYQVWTQG